MVQTMLPNEVHRRYRSLDTIAFWKGTEYRTFLHYMSVVIYKDYMFENAYKHYLLYFCAITLFSTKAHQQFWQLGGRLLTLFVKNFETYYGRSHLTSNVHNLLHVYSDVLNHGELDKFSSYRSENHYQLLKKWVHSGTRCLEQVANRVHHFASIHNFKTCTPPPYPILTRNQDGVHINKNFVLRPNRKDQWFLTRSKGIVKFLKVSNNANQTVLIGSQFDCMAELFHLETSDDIGRIDLSSSDLHIYKVNNNTSTSFVEVPLKSILCKLVCVPLPSRSLSRYVFDPDLSADFCAFFPLLHTFQ
ncbi:uncharacterized protein LOC128278887 [Anopheles cruzii]|uniref:uncharacterized protein LOC128278887 n=1 Tax=Anopheles cruzii TaxID=68878 RepID=UPI0022EC59EC|nr:uncharacterized protein LOC128278887 [Anopheles cruzii]